MALPDLDTMTDRVFYVLRDSERAFITETEVWYFLNEAYTDLCARLRLKQTYATGTVSAGGVLPFPSDFVELLDGGLIIDGVRMILVDDDTFLSYYAEGEEPYTTIVRVNSTQFETYPAVADTAEYELWYVSRPAAMTVGTATPTAITEELVPRLINYARAHCKWAEGEDAEGERYYQLYAEGLPGAPRASRRTRPASVDMIPAASPFDEDAL